MEREKLEGLVVSAYEISTNQVALDTSSNCREHVADIRTGGEFKSEEVMENVVQRCK